MENSFGDQLREIMYADETNVKDVAKRCGLTEATIRGLLNDKLKPHNDTLLKLIRGLKLNVHISRPDRPPLGLSTKRGMTNNGFDSCVPSLDRPKPVRELSMAVRVAIIATSEGCQPTTPQRGEVAIKKALDICKKGWPTEKWEIFDIEMEPAPRGVFNAKPTVIMTGIRNSIAKAKLIAAYQTRFTDLYEVVE